MWPPLYIILLTALMYLAFPNQGLSQCKDGRCKFSVGQDYVSFYYEWIIYKDYPRDGIEVKEVAYGRTPLDFSEAGGNPALALRVRNLRSKKANYITTNSSYINFIDGADDNFRRPTEYPRLSRDSRSVDFVFPAKDLVEKTWGGIDLYFFYSPRDTEKSISSKLAGFPALSYRITPPHCSVAEHEWQKMEEPTCGSVNQYKEKWERNGNCPAAVEKAENKLAEFEEGHRGFASELEQSLKEAGRNLSKQLFAYERYANDARFLRDCNHPYYSKAVEKVRALQDAAANFRVLGTYKGPGTIEVSVTNSGAETFDQLSLKVKAGASVLEPEVAFQMSQPEFEDFTWVVTLSGLEKGRYLLEAVSSATGGQRSTEVEVEKELPAGIAILPALTTEGENRYTRVMVHGGTPPFTLYYKEEGETAYDESANLIPLPQSSPHQRIFKVAHSDFENLAGGQRVAFYISGKDRLPGPAATAFFTLGYSGVSAQGWGWGGSLAVAGLAASLLLLVIYRGLPRDNPWKMYFQSRK